MTVRTTCPHCKAALEVDAGHAGRRVLCGVCREVFVATPDEPPPPPQPDELPRASRASSRRREDEPDDRPSRRRGWDEEDDWYDRPRRRRRRSRGGDGFAVASLVLGIISLLVFCLWPVGLPVSAVGMALGAVGLRRRARRLAVAGLVLSTVGLIFAGGFAVITVAGVVKAEYERGSQTNPKRPVFKGKS